MANKEIANTTFASTVVRTSSLGANNGVAELGSDGKLKSSQLPAGVDEVIEVANAAALPASGSASKIYITLDDNKTFRWGGTVYVEISASLALGETSSTAHAGDKGKIAYDHSQTAHESVGAGAAAVTSHESTYNHGNLHTHANKAYLDKINESAGDATYDGNRLAKFSEVPTKISGADVATGTNDTGFATAKALKDSGKVWVSANAYLNYNSTDSCIDIEFTS